MKTTSSSKTLVPIYQTTQYHIPEDSNVNKKTNIYTYLYEYCIIVGFTHSEHSWAISGHRFPVIPSNSQITILIFIKFCMTDPYQIQCDMWIWVIILYYYIYIHII